MRENNIDLKIRIFPNDLSEFVYWYLGHFHTPFEGYTKQTKDDFDTEVVKQSLINYINNCKKYKVNIYREKPFYHVYASICILKRNSYDLSEEEINNINILHDRKEEDFEIRKQLIDEMMEEINSWQQV